jgi:hypothetical protein
MRVPGVVALRCEPATRHGAEVSATLNTSRAACTCADVAASTPSSRFDQAQLGLLLASEPVMTQDVDALDVAERCDVRRVALELLGGSPEASCPTFRFAERLAALRKTVWVRYVLVPGWNDLTRPALRAARICGV